MARYVVQRLHNAQRLGRAIEIEAESDLRAAENILGEPLVPEIDGGSLAARLAAEVYLSQAPTEKRRFSRPSPRRAQLGR